MKKAAISENLIWSIKRVIKHIFEQMTCEKRILGENAARCSDLHSSYSIGLEGFLIIWFNTAVLKIIMTNDFA